MGGEDNRAALDFSRFVASLTRQQKLRFRQFYMVLFLSHDVIEGLVKDQMMT